VPLRHGQKYIYEEMALNALLELLYPLIHRHGVERAVVIAGNNIKVL
jgi:hypothetical protein